LLSSPEEDCLDEVTEDDVLSEKIMAVPSELNSKLFEDVSDYELY